MSSFNLTPYLTFLLITSTLGPLLFGYHLAELNAPSEVIRCLPKNDPHFEHAVFHGMLEGNEALPRCIPMSPFQFGLVTSSFTLGGLIGALAAGPITARQGRVRAMLYAAFLGCLGGLNEAVGGSIAVLSLGRLVSGLSAGGAMVVAPIYIFDIAPPGKKGFFGSFTQVMVNVGILITQVLGYFLSQEAWQLWRVILAVAGFIGLVQAVFLFLSGQESPKYLAEHGKPAQARKVLQKIRGRGVDIDAEVAAWGGISERHLDDEAETLLGNEETRPDNDNDNDNNDTLTETQALPVPTKSPHQPPPPQTLQSTNPPILGALAVLRNPHTRPAVFAIVMIMLSQQFTGINSIVMYGVSLLSDLLSSNSALLNVFVSLLNVFTTILAAPLVEKLGRKTCLLMSITGMGMSSVFLAFGIQNDLKILSALAVITFVSSFGLGLGPVPFILPSEFVESNAVGAVQSWGLATNWIATFAVAQFFPVLNERMGKGEVYFIFAGMALFFGGFVMWFVPESRGKRDVDEVWGRRRVGRVE